MSRHYVVKLKKLERLLLFEYQNTRTTFYAPSNREPEYLVFIILFSVIRTKCLYLRIIEKYFKEKKSFLYFHTKIHNYTCKGFFICLDLSLFCDLELTFPNFSSTLVSKTLSEIIHQTSK